MTNRTALIFTAAAFAVAANASADVTIADWTDDDHFEFNVNYMPDLDQRRAFLPGDGGAFCVPTATMNLFAYAAEWGFDTVEPGPGVWQGAVPYATMTGHLSDLGTAMSTGPTGTGIAGWLAGTAAWTDGQPLTYHAIYKTADWCPTLSDATLLAAFGGIVNVCYGRYEFADAPEPILGARPGGHCVTMARSFSNGPGTLELWVRDPNNSGSIFTQAPWANSVFDVQNMLVLQDWDNNGSLAPVEGTVINYDPNGGKLRLIDSVFAVFPSMGYSWSTVEVNVAPIASGLWTGPASQTFSPPPGLGFRDVAQSFDGTTYYAIAVVDPLGVVYEADPLTGNLTELAQIIDATDIAVGRHGHLYVLALGHLIKLNPDGTVLDVETLPFSGQAIAYRDSTDEVIVMSSISGRMRSYTVDLDLVADYDLPNAPWSTDLSMAVRESDGALAFTIPGQPDTVYGINVELEPALITSWQLSGTGASSVAFDDRGNLVVGRTDGSVTELEQDIPCGWCWNVVSPSVYDGVQTAGAFRVSRSRTNYDPVINAFDDIDTPAEQLEYTGTIVYDCPGDFDNDQLVAVSDLLSLLARWGTCAGCPEDIDGDGVVAVSDLLDLLVRWGACDI